MYRNGKEDNLNLNKCQEQFAQPQQESPPFLCSLLIRRGALASATCSKATCYHICMVPPACDGCRDRDVRIAELEARVAELERFQRERTYLREESRIERDLRLLTGESEAMKAVRLSIQQVAQ